MIACSNGAYLQIAPDSTAGVGEVRGCYYGPQATIAAMPRPENGEEFC
jgi:hypothetical protein